MAQAGIVTVRVLRRADFSSAPACSCGRLETMMITDVRAQQDSLTMATASASRRMQKATRSVVWILTCSLLDNTKQQVRQSWPLASWFAPSHMRAVGVRRARLKSKVATTGQLHYNFPT